MNYLTTIFGNIWFLFIFYLPCSFMFPIPLLPLVFIENKCGFSNTINNLYTNFVIKYCLRTRYEIINETKRIEKGILLSNHVSGFDNLYDSHVTNSILIADSKIKWYHGLYYYLQYLSGQVFDFDKTNTTRHKVYAGMSNLYNNKGNKIPRMLFYPEGTRKNIDYKSSYDLSLNIKYGLLKSIYENKEYPVQLFISKNKEHSFINNSFDANYIYSIYSNRVNPDNYKTFELFIEKITSEWLSCLNKLNNFDKSNNNNNFYK